MARRAVRRKPEISRGEILDAALACFSARGYHETSVDDIATRAGLSKGAIYWHFEGKRELFLALVDRFSEPALADLESVAEAPLDSAEHLDTLGNHLGADAVAGQDHDLERLCWHSLLPHETRAVQGVAIAGCAVFMSAWRSSSKSSPW